MPQFKRRFRKHKKVTRFGNGTCDSNTLEISPDREDFKNNKQKHETLRQQLQQPTMSSKKKKRLDKYIEKKLKKEENLELIKGLASQKFDTSLLQSSKHLGKQKVSKREILAQSLKKQRAGIATDEDHHNLYEPASLAPNDVYQSVGSRSLQLDCPRTDGRIEKDLSTGVVTGSGLKRPLEVDDEGNPVIKKKQRLKKPQPPAIMHDEPSWDGFSSEGTSASSLDDSASNATSNSDEESSSDEDTGVENKATSYPLFASSYNSSRPKINPGSSEFKTWAIQQVNEARDFSPSLPAAPDHSVLPSMSNQPRRPIEYDPLPPELQVKLEPSSRRIHSVQVDRPKEIQEARMKLPIFAEEQKIMEAIHNNSIVIVCGATGSGKTTQIPQFLFEAGYGDPKGPTPGLIGVTQPRRVAAVTMAKRVGEELGDTSKSSYQVRFDSTADSHTAIKFMTDGILLREISEDFLLTRYSVIVIDEAHERSVNTDILIGMISRIVGLRDKNSQKDPSVKPLKLIIMSATLMVDSFLNNPRLFPGGTPPLVESEGRQYPVTMHFSRRTHPDYVEEAFQKVIKGHRKLPPGGMLVFLTGQNEIDDLAQKLRRAFSNRSIPQSNILDKINAKALSHELDDLDPTEEFASLTDEEGSDDDEEDKEFDIADEKRVNMKALILTLYSQLPHKEQLRVFNPPPDNTRLIVLATNVAETSITIPGIRYVFDAGRAKEKKYDKITGVTNFEIGWISKASALQRAGRAGRTGPGHCYRLYSSAMYERDFPEHAQPEILRTPIEGVILKLKSMGLRAVKNFPFPTPPDLQSFANAEKLLSHLGALDRDGNVTEMGQMLSVFPVSPRLAKMIVIGDQYDSLYLVTLTVAAMAVPELFARVPVPQVRWEAITGDDDAGAVDGEDLAKDARNKAYNEAHARFSARDPTSDALKLTTALGAYLGSKDKDSFCSKWFLNPKAAKEAQLLYLQLLNIIALNQSVKIDATKTKLQPPSDVQVTVIKQIVAAGFLDQVAIRADLAPVPPALPRKPKRATDVPYLTLFPTQAGRAMDDEISRYVFIHPSSVLAHTSPENMPPYLIYSQIQRSKTATIYGTKQPKMWMSPLTAVTGGQLTNLGRKTTLIEHGKPIGKIEPSNSGRSDERIVWCVPSLVGERGGHAWPLPAEKILQKRDKMGVWNIIKAFK